MKKTFYLVPFLLFTTLVLANDFELDEVESHKPVYMLEKHSPQQKHIELTTPESDTYDVLRYRLELDIRPDIEQVYGKVTIDARSLINGLDNIDLDLVSLRVDSAFSDETELVVDNQTSTLNIFLDTVYAKDDSFQVTVYYHGRPLAEPGSDSWGGFYFYGDRNAYTLGVGLNTSYVSMGRHWMPCHDEPWDKATFDMTFIVPYDKYLASNGVLVEHIKNPVDSTAVFHWIEDHQTATYLVCLAMNDYATVEYSVNDTLPVFIYTTKDDSANSAVHFENVPAMVEIYSDLFGPYPFDKVGYALTPKGAMEHQTCISYPAGAVSPTHTYDYLIAHELSHHWWGDWVTVGDWRDIWLNEGFATYSEPLFFEKFKNKEAYDKNIREDMRAYFNAEAAEGTLPIYDHPVMWGVHTYEKGGCVMHMLRNVIGDSAFFKTLREYGRRFAFGSVTTPDFQNVVEDISGRDMDWFFDQWIYGPGYPVYDYAWSCSPTGQGDYVLNATIQQGRADSVLFDMPLEIGFHYGSIDSILTIQMWEKAQSFQLRLPDSIESVLIDPANKLLNKDNKTDYAPFEILNYTINDTQSGNGNGNPEAGETVGFSLLVKSTGSAVSNMSAVLSSSDNIIPVIDSTADYGNMAYLEAKQSQLNSFILKVDSTAGLRQVKMAVQFFINDLPAYKKDFQLNTYTNKVAFIDDFEGLLGYWDTGKSWHPHFWARSGQNCMTDSPDGYYENDQENVLTLNKNFNLAEHENAFLEFYHIYLFAQGDSGLVQVLDNTKNWQTVAAFTGTMPFEWQRCVTDLSRFCVEGNSDIRLRFDLKSDAADVYDGWYIDDMILTVDSVLTGVDENGPVQLPHSLNLAQNYPNPFNPETVILYELPEATPVRIDIYNSLGQKVLTLIDSKKPAGTHKIIWNGRDSAGQSVPSGIYFYRLSTDSQQLVRKMLLLR
ncbi:T9SS type A sorting domain-containing protein [candidate division KSB1 bacterium]|nr:T9SS type A sorting domain-containing protein [candidate division KSB1 bacterium]